MGGTRPARSAAKKGASKINAGAKKQSSKNSDIDMDSDNHEPAPEGDDDDSDEYVEPPEDKNNRHNDDEDDEDVHMGVDEELDEDAGVKPKKQRRRKQTNNFTIPLEEMNRLLSTRNNADIQVEGGNTANATVAGTELSLERMGGEDVVGAPVSLRSKVNAAGEPKRRAQRSRPNKPMHKKGEMSSSKSLPETWKYSYQGPTQEDIHHVSMTAEYLATTVYPNIASSIKDFRIITEPSALDEYFPVLTTTSIHTREQDIDMRTMTAKYMGSTKRTGINDYYILNAGFSVWAMDWCPIPSHADSPKDNVDYVAIGGFPDTAENCIARDQLYPLGKQDAHPNMIQIWSMNCNTNDQGELQGNPETYLSLCILHSYGAVLDLKWCPTGGRMDAGSSGGLTRLGILAAVFSDGTIRIFSVPEPRSLRAHLGIGTPENSSPEPVYIEFPEPFATIRMGDTCFMCINWGTSERLAAGLTNGTIAVWDMKLMLSQTKETLAEKDSEYLDPIHLPQVHDVSVRCVDWLRSVNPAEVPWILASSGYDGRIRYTDLHDIYVQIDIKTILGVPMASLFNSWAEAIVYCDFDFGGKMDQLYLESRGFRLFNAKGTIWDFSSSDYQPFVAAAISDGRVKISNPAYKAKRGYGLIQNNLYQVQENTMDADRSSQVDSISSSSQVEEEGRAQRSSFTYKEAEEREYVSKTAGYLSFYGANVAVQKVQWSKCFHSAAWLASGSAGGLVRIDNTMLREEEGGKGNKIAYQPDAYLLKKRMAKGGSIGPDGQYVPARKGRPPKEGGPRRLNKGKNVKRATAKAKITSRKGAKSKSGDDDQDSDEEEPEAEESGHDDEDDEDGGQSSSIRGLRDEDEFVGRTKDTDSPHSEKRTTRLSTGRIAPIFTRKSSKATAASEEDEEEGDGEQEEDDDEERESGEAGAEGASSPSKKSTRKPTCAAVAATLPRKDPPKSPGKPRGRPRKNLPLVDPVTSNQTLLSIMRVSRPEHSATDETDAASKDTSSADVEMAEVTVEESVVAAVATELDISTSPAQATATTAIATSKTSAVNVATPKKPRGRPPKARPVEIEMTMTTATATTTGGSYGEPASVVTSNEEAPTLGTDNGAAAGSTTDNREADVQREDDPLRQSSDSVASSRASSAVPEAAAVAAAKAPATSGKKGAAAPRITRKRKEEEKAKGTNRTLTDLWGKK